MKGGGSAHAAKEVFRRAEAGLEAPFVTVATAVIRNGLEVAFGLAGAGAPVAAMVKWCREPVFQELDRIVLK